MPMRACLPLLVLALAACTNETSIPEAATQIRASSGASAAPAAPVTSFDGRYTGEVTLNPDRTRACPQSATGQREINVRQGRATMLINPQTRQTLTGVTGADGSVRMADSLDRTIATSGIFTTEGFLGEFRSGVCSYAVHMRKA